MIGVRSSRACGVMYLFRVATFSLLTSFAAAEPPSLTHLTPAGGQRGTKVTVTCAGKFPQWPASIWSPGVEAVAGMESGQLEITIPSDLAADRIWIRLYNAEGASAAVPFLIGSLKEQSEQEPNNSPKTAQRLDDPNVTINGVLTDAEVDSFAMTLAAGQTLVVDLDANNQLGSPMDAVLQVAALDGTVLAENHDDVELDPRLAFTPKTAGNYLVRLFAYSSTPNTAIVFQGGANYVYRLTLSTGPVITHTVPLAVSQSNPGEVEVVGWNLPPGAKLSVVPFGAPRATDTLEGEPLADVRNRFDSRLGFVFSPSLGGSARVRLVSHGMIPGIAQGTQESPCLLSLPITATGRLQTPRQTDWYQLPLSKGQHVVITAESRNIESAVQPVLRLFDPAGGLAAAVDDAAPSPAKVLAHNTAAEGDYRLSVHDRFQQAGDRNFYRLSARLEEPDFELTVGADALVVTREKPAELVVNIVRRAPPGGSVGPITVEAHDLPAGVEAVSVVSETTGDTSGKVTLKFTAGGPAFSGPIRIRGTAKEPAELTRWAQTPKQLGACLGYFWLTVVAAP